MVTFYITACDVHYGVDEYVIGSGGRVPPALSHVGVTLRGRVLAHQVPEMGALTFGAPSRDVPPRNDSRSLLGLVDASLSPYDVETWVRVMRWAGGSEERIEAFAAAAKLGDLRAGFALASGAQGGKISR